MGVKKLMMARMLMNAEENVLKVFLRPVFPDETLAK